MPTNFVRFFVLLIIFLGFSYFLSTSAIPATRTQNLKCEDASTLPSLAKVGNNYGEEVVLVHMDEGFTERRIDLEIQDYDGTGANRDHEPKPPRRI
ncbi:uncharacterized protein [Cicer arietinum]|uniref:Uncharacterized protein LOC101500413 n=1 Tax=Cicer arietinum TaxID=3827 RepID=A0A1S2XR48_CICAR|nr:uncharacterized protein LOC101500413 [Cicer arietinum]